MEDQAKVTLTAILWWILIGMVLVSVTFVAASGHGLWRAIDAAGIAAGVYIIAITLFIARKPLRWSTRIWAYIVAGCSVGIIAFSWYQAQSSSTEQAALKRQQGEAQIRGAAIEHMTRIFHRTLEDYYQPGVQLKHSLIEVFYKRNGDLKDGGKRSFMIGRRWVLTLASASPDSVVLVAQTDEKERAPEFRYWKGFIQEKMVLTAKGVTHVSEN